MIMIHTLSINFANIMSIHIAKSNRTGLIKLFHNHTFLTKQYYISSVLRQSPSPNYAKKSMPILSTKLMNTCMWSLILPFGRLVLKKSFATTTLSPPCAHPSSIDRYNRLQKSLRNKEIDQTTFKSVLWKIWDCLLTLLRSIRIGVTFFPLLLLYPFTYAHSSILHVWRRILLFCLELSGPIFIKLGQWASTRRDLFSEELCLCLSSLQRKSRPHSFFYTEKAFENAYGPNWRDFIILANNGKPVGSGCCGQVYKGWISNRRAANISFPSSRVNSYLVEILEMFWIGDIISALQPYSTDVTLPVSYDAVAIKVLHPRMEKLLRRDLIIMKAGANILTFLIPSLHWLSLPDCVDDFSFLMKAQVDLSVEATNLERFAVNFASNKHITFPKPIKKYSNSYILVQTFEKGEPMQDYVSQSHPDDARLDLADLGINTILKMIFVDNFIHGDLHPGNMLVRDREADIWSFLYGSTYQDIVILDCGIVISLEEREKSLLRAVFSNVVKKNGKRVAELFLDNSNNRCTDRESFKKQLHILVKTSVDRSVSTEMIEMSTMVTQLFSTMIHYKVKVDGGFSAVILALVVVEGLGRSLNPNIDIIAKAKPILLGPVLQFFL